MCIAYFSQQPLCDCIYSSEVVRLCSLFTGLRENRDKTSFSPKLVTSRCQSLNLYFNGVNYVSVDVEDYDLLPNGLDCPEVELVEEVGKPGRCPLCDSQGVSKFLKAKGIECTPKAAHDPQDKAGEEVAEDAGEKAAEKSVERSVGEPGDRLAGMSIGKRGIVDGASRAQEMLERARTGLPSKGARSGPTESTSASRG